MKQTTKMIAYVMIMALLITSTLFYSGLKNHQQCPVCNHSIASEGNTSNTHVALLNKNK